LLELLLTDNEGVNLINFVVKSMLWL